MEQRATLRLKSASVLGVSHSNSLKIDQSTMDGWFLFRSTSVVSLSSCCPFRWFSSRKPIRSAASSSAGFGALCAVPHPFIPMSLSF
jgi:hypothetical protein